MSFAKRWKNIPCSWMKNKYCENVYATQGNLHIQCNPYQNTMNFLHRVGTNNLKICVETEKTLKSQGNIEKENQCQGYYNAGFQAVLQSCDHQDSVVLARNQKNRSMEQNREPWNEQKTWTEISSKKVYIWPTSTWENAPHHWPSGKYKSKPQWDIRKGDRTWTVSYTHLTLPTTCRGCRSRWSPYH